MTPPADHGRVRHDTHLTAVEPSVTHTGVGGRASGDLLSRAGLEARMSLVGALASTLAASLPPGETLDHETLYGEDGLPA